MKEEVEQQGQGSGLDSGMVGGFEASDKPMPGKLIALDSTGKTHIGAFRTGAHVGGASNYSEALFSTTATFPTDNTIPQNTEGAEWLTLAYTPANANNTLRLSGLVQCMGGRPDGLVIAAIFVDNTANALATFWRRTWSGTSSNEWTESFSFSYETTAGSTSARTYKVRLGRTAGTLYVNSDAGIQFFGGTEVSHFKIEEFKA